MYAVVGCSDCEALWILEDRPETSQCPRCGTRHRTERLKRFVETDDEDHARDVRASMLASRQGRGDAFAELDSFADMERRVDDAVVDDDEYLAASGVDPEAVAEAGERPRGSGESSSRREVVRAALRELDAPDEAAVVEYAGERGVPEGYVRDAVEKLRRAGEVIERDGGLRLV